MKAVVLEAPEQLEYRDVPVPELGTGMARVRVGAASICGSDMLRVYHGAARVLPIVLGHEFAGEIEAVNGVSDTWLGQRVAIAPLIPCMTCENCQRELYACCTRYSFIGSRVQGGFAETVDVPAANLVPLPDELDLTLGALVEPISVGLHALARAGGAPGKRVAVIGVGSIGLLAVRSAVWSGAALALAVDIEDDNLAAAAAMGATAVYNPRSEDVPRRIQAEFGGVDIAIEASGARAGLELALAMCAAGGSIVCVGNQPLDQALSLRWIEHLMRQELQVYGAWMSYSAPFPGQEWLDSVALLAQDTDLMRTTFTHDVTLARLPGMFARLHAGGFPHRKVLVTY
ncbi:MAG: galactitol-1-phosphate 5-dehydrogenase [Chloroflexota bacterium]|nr:galactitol-1-phosphate 5-dehydrogenase [Chloroflexota bacterium]